MDNAQIPVIHDCILENAKLDNANISKSTLKCFKLSSCTIANATLIACDIKDCEVRDSTVTDCQLSDSSINNSQISDTTLLRTKYERCSMTGCSTKLSPLALQKFPPEIRDRIFKYSIWQHMRPDGEALLKQTTPPIVVALRSHDDLYAEAVRIYQRTYTLTVQKGNNYPMDMIGVVAWKNLRYMKIDCSYAVPSHNLPPAIVENTPITLDELWIARGCNMFENWENLLLILERFQHVRKLKVQFYPFAEPWTDFIEKLNTYMKITGKTISAGRVYGKVTWTADIK